MDPSPSLPGVLVLALDVMPVVALFGRSEEKRRVVIGVAEHVVPRTASFGKQPSWAMNMLVPLWPRDT